MRIICGTDLSRNSYPAVSTADALATRFDQHLNVVHVMHQSIADSMAKAVGDMHQQDCHAGLEEIAETLNSRGNRSQTHLLHGHADEELIKLSTEDDVSMIVVGSLGHRDKSRWHIGSFAERIAETGHKPTLVVRDEVPFKHWTEDRPLKIVVAWEFNDLSDNALRWIAEWRQHGPCEITLLHVDWPPEEARRLGVRNDYFSTHNDPIVQNVLERDARERASKILGSPPDHIVVEGSYGRPVYHFTHVIKGLRPDLVVCGTHQRHGLSRLAHSSFSRGLLHNCHASILMVPHAKSASHSIPEIRKILVTTDFSELGNRAIPSAYAQVRNGGEVFLMHVIEPFQVPSPMLPKYTSGDSTEESDDERREAAAKLSQLVPSEAQERGIKTDCRIVEGHDLAATICQCADRFGVDQICMASHGRSGLSNLVLGSISTAVIARAHRPVTIVPPPIH